MTVVNSVIIISYTIKILCNGITFLDNSFAQMSLLYIEFLPKQFIIKRFKNC